MAKAPRVRAPPSCIAYHTIDRYGGVAHTSTYMGRHAPATGNSVSAGTWWPDFGPTTNEFSYLYRSHPTETVFDNCVKPFANQQKALMERSFKGQMSPHSSEYSGSATASSPQQFRHPNPQTEALMSSTIVYPYKKGGRRKVDDPNHWKASCAVKRRPVYFKGPLLDDVDRLQIHPLNRAEHGGSEFQNIHKSCSAAELAAGTPTGTCPVEALTRTISMPAFDERTSTLGGSLKTLPAGTVANTIGFTMKRPVPQNTTDQAKLGSWLAKRTIATRDVDAAGHAACLLKKLPVDRF
eukprot:TRINITY_DN19083_c0_g1_i1.p1 TRINITY_DN19083_c0_g1~~TRINITY_DN19083_c0_g1_i1.p1  ORF type:complete len:295 (+),score=44.99 TRINITY_DN19083_c0_g1_i1:145-1029(+)